MRQRILTAILGGPVFLTLVWYGGWPLAVAMVVIAAWAMTEWCALWRERDMLTAATALAALPGLAGIMYAFWAGQPWVAGAALTGSLVLAFAVQLSSPERHARPDFLLSVLGLVYIGLTLGHLVALRGFGPWHALFPVISVWACDSAAYFIGVRWGQRRLAPRISPKKSVEGALAGVCAGAAAGCLFAPALSLGGLTGAMAGGSVAAVGQLGDLAESALKRYAGAKDSGRSLPGHGGMLDRADSLLFALPLAYYLLMAFKG